MSARNESSRQRRQSLPDEERPSQRSRVIVSATPGTASTRQHSANSSCPNSNEDISPITRQRARRNPNLLTTPSPRRTSIYNGARNTNGPYRVSWYGDAG